MFGPATIISAAFALSVAAQAPSTNLQGCVTKYDASIDYFPEKIDSANLTNLAYTYNKSYKTIVNSFSNETVVLYQCGTPKPDVPGAAQIISVPIQNLTTASTTIVTYLELLGKRSAIKHTTSGTLGYISSPCIQQLVATDASSIIEVDSKNKTHALEQIASTDVFFHYLTSIAVNTTNAVNFPASADPGVKGRAEWVGFLGAFFNLEGKANQISTALATNYAQLAAAANATSTRPVVAWVEYQKSYGPQYPEGWKINYKAYQTDFTKAAGAIPYLPATTEGTMSVTGTKTFTTTYSYNSSAAFIAALAPVDIVIDLSFANVNSSDFSTSFAIQSASPVKFFNSKQVFMFNKQISGGNGGNQFFEAATVLQNVVLADLISVTHPEVVGSSYTPRFLRNAFKDQQSVQTAKECKDVAAAEVVPIIQVVKASSAQKVATVFALALVAALL
ncbi:hypothetical protein HDU79_000673 [Rhizoclosmatium sp. JEL0117]|nr:hypothetical protein HDU79_000673 [Rhizoclosmatium sp. JEL0117]